MVSHGGSFGRAEKHIDRERGMILRKNSVRGAIRKSSRRNSLLDPSQDSRSNSVTDTPSQLVFVY